MCKNVKSIEYKSHKLNFANSLIFILFFLKMLKPFNFYFVSIYKYKKFKLTNYI